MTIALRYSTRSDVGLVRANNQDSAFAGERLLLVADGMGGHAGGDVASALCVASIAPLNNEPVDTSSMLERLGEAVERARIDLVTQARDHRSLAGMGTTVTALLLGENKLAMAHMGDSRGYLLRDGRLTQVTKDHTFVQHLVDAGKITPDEAETHPQRSVVMRVLGDFELDLVPDLSIREARPGDRWLLCSDGLSGFVRFETMEQTLRDVQDIELCSEYLIQLALRGGGSDNITCVVADIYDTDAPDSPCPTETFPQPSPSAPSPTVKTFLQPSTRAAHHQRASNSSPKPTTPWSPSSNAQKRYAAVTPNLTPTPGHSSSATLTSPQSQTTPPPARDPPTPVKTSTSMTSWFPPNHGDVELYAPSSTHSSSSRSSPQLATALTGGDRTNTLLAPTTGKSPSSTDSRNQ